MSTKETSVFSIKCTNCAAPLKILGGGRVTTVTCEYCGSVLDMTDHYKVVSQFHDKYRPPVPFTLGMQGRIKEVEWTIIGWVAYKTVDFPIERWSEFFLYSPLYGYGWLIYEEGDLSFSKRVRDFPLREWKDKGKPKTVFYQKGHYIAAEDPYSVEIDFVQGELSWIAKADDKIRCWDYNGVNRKSLSIEESKQEVEVYLNERLNSQAVYESFGVEQGKRVKSKTTLSDKVFDEETDEKQEKAVSFFTKGIAVLLILLLAVILSSFLSHKLVLKNTTNQPFNEMFTLHSGAFIAEINIDTPSPAVLNACRFVLHKSDKKILLIDKSKLESDNPHLRYTWMQENNKVKIYIKLEEGLYRAELQLTKPLPAGQKVTITIEERIIRLSYILPLFIMMLPLVLFDIRRKWIPSKYQKYFWWIIGGTVAVAFFGVGIAVFIFAFYFFVQPIIDSRKEDRS